MEAIPNIFDGCLTSWRDLSTRCQYFRFKVGGPRSALPPSGLVTATLTVPAPCAGVVAFNPVELTKETPDAAVPPKETVAPLTK